MADKVFVDTNVLAYSRDASEPKKQSQAIAWMAYLWKAQAGRLIFQVLQEFYGTVTEKLRPGLSSEEARRDVRSLLAWKPVAVDASMLEGAWIIQDQHKFPWWGALILSPAQAAECRFLLSEALQHNQELGNLRILNPFRTAPTPLQPRHRQCSLLGVVTSHRNKIKKFSHSSYAQTPQRMQSPT